MGKGFNNHFRKEKCTYSFLLTKVLELDGVSVLIQANRWNLPRVLAQLNANTFCVGMWCRRQIWNVEDDDEKAKQDFEFSLFHLETCSFHSILSLFSQPPAPKLFLRA